MGGKEGKLINYLEYLIRENLIEMEIRRVLFTQKDLIELRRKLESDFGARAVYIRSRKRVVSEKYVGRV